MLGAQAHRLHGPVSRIVASGLFPNILSNLTAPSQSRRLSLISVRIPHLRSTTQVSIRLRAYLPACLPASGFVAVSSSHVGCVCLSLNLSPFNQGHPRRGRADGWVQGELSEGFMHPGCLRQDLLAQVGVLLFPLSLT